MELDEQFEIFAATMVMADAKLNDLEKAFERNLGWMSECQEYMNDSRTHRGIEAVAPKVTFSDVDDCTNKDNAPCGGVGEATGAMYVVPEEAHPAETLDKQSSSRLRWAWGCRGS